MTEKRDNVIIRIQSMVNHLPSSTQSKPITFQVADHLRQVNEKDYEPEILAIGPIHRGKDHVKDMEQHKVRYLKQILQRGDEFSIEKYVMELRELEEMARQYYPKSFHLDRDEFVEMLLLDGCFVIELIRKYSFDYLRDKNDFIFRFDQTISQLRHDLMLFENQLPFFVLNQLFELTRMEDPDDNISYLVLLFVDDMFPWPLHHSKSETVNAEHLLGLVYQSCLSFSISTKNFIANEGHNQENNLVHINSTSKLKDAGISFSGSKEITLLDVRFADGVLKLPPLNISDKTESLLRNLMAYEQCLPNDHLKYVTDFVFLMHCLVNSTKDIQILRRYGIISNLLGGDDMICRMFNTLGKNVLRSSDFCYSDVFQRVNRHCSLRHKRWMAKLMRNHFNSPWAMVSVLAAAILLLLTFIQTVFSVLSYKK